MDVDIGYGTTGFNLPVLSEAILHVNALGHSQVILKFDEKEFKGVLKAMK